MNDLHAAQAIIDLADFAVRRTLIDEEDRIYTINRLLDIMRLDAPEAEVPSPGPLCETVTPLLQALVDSAVRRHLIGESADERERFSTRLCGEITPHPALVRARFEALRRAQGPAAATDWFYALCRACDYIRVDHIAKNMRFFADASCGELEITINLSKPEKDPRDIAAQRDAPQVGYPKCMLCAENPGYAGRPGYPARHNHRMMPLALGGDAWYLQYSPYMYYPEHCIVLNRAHRPMRTTERTFRAMFDFVERFPHYFLGSNADLPVVGGSILSHDHFQGGRYAFPMDRAGVRVPLRAPWAGISACVLDWPMTVVRLRALDREALTQAAMALLQAWRAHSDEELGIYAETDAAHNAITPILRREEDAWRLDLVLRNNRTSAEHPLGIFHPHARLHHIKMENIGLIEVMGLFILPGRLRAELGEMEKYLIGERALSERPGADSPLDRHYQWTLAIARRTGTNLSAEGARAAIRTALGATCGQVLADAGVYKPNATGTAGLLRFLRGIGYETTAQPAHK